MNLYKIYTIGDCYVVMGFLDDNNRKSPEEEANDVALLAISMIETINKIRNKLNITTLNMRIGVHTVIIHLVFQFLFFIGGHHWRSHWYRLG